MSNEVDEAAESYDKSHWEKGIEGDAFKAGVEWQKTNTKSYTIEGIKNAYSLLNRAYEFNKQDMGWDEDFENWKQKYLESILK